MRNFILITLFLMPQVACLTQRDASIWQEFKSGTSSKKTEAQGTETPVQAPAIVPDSEAK
ncbi:MAG: hypothetical protein NTX25_05655 [Proteobacteria bacterium]|nr:hypothetical protein [Pseudomonadota bacterium]